MNSETLSVDDGTHAFGPLSAQLAAARAAGFATD